MILKYDAPNNVKFRLEYLSSKDYKNTTKFVRNEAINVVTATSVTTATASSTAFACRSTSHSSNKTTL